MTFHIYDTELPGRVHSEMGVKKPDPPVDRRYLQLLTSPDFGASLPISCIAMSFFKVGVVLLKDLVLEFFIKIICFINMKPVHFIRTKLKKIWGEMKTFFVVLKMRKNKSMKYNQGDER